MINLAFSIVFLISFLTVSVSSYAEPVKSIEKMSTQIQKKFSAPELTASAVRNGKSTSFVFVDVRPKEERISRIESSLSLSEYHHAKKSSFKNKILIFYCTIGNRSSQFLTKEISSLKKLGLKGFNLRGGILGWVHSGRPLVDEKGLPTKKVHIYGDRWNLLPKGYKPVF